MTDFPYREYFEYELMEEFEKLSAYRPERKLRKRNLGYKCSNAFFQYERMHTPAGRRISNLEYWQVNKKSVIAYHQQYQNKQDLYGIIQFLNHSPAQFPPNIAIQLYSKFKATRILDPFAGWGDRCVAAMARNLDYTGIDSNRNLKVPYREMVQFYPHYSRVQMIFKPVEKVDLSKLDFDFVLTSPPFWDSRGRLIENYNDMPSSDYREFMDHVFIPTVVRCSLKAKWSCYYIPKHMASYVSGKTGIKWNKRLTYGIMGNKKYQENSIYCLKQVGT
jgi:hypothetical protein